MADLVNQIKQNLPDGCFAKGKLSKEGCTVSLKGAPRPSIKIDMDNKTVLVKQGETKCDYIFIGGCDDAFPRATGVDEGKTGCQQSREATASGGRTLPLLVLFLSVSKFNSSRLRFVANFTELRKRNYRNRPIEFASRVNVCISNY